MQRGEVGSEADEANAAHLLDRILLHPVAPLFTSLLQLVKVALRPFLRPLETLHANVLVERREERVVVALASLHQVKETGSGDRTVG